MIDLTQEILKELLNYDQDTGIFIWKERNVKWCKDQSYCDRWNAKYSGKVAGAKAMYNGGKLYLQISIFGKLYKAHHLAFLFIKNKWPVGVDHEDGNGLHNWWLNLREADALENGKNTRIHSNNKSGISGVNWDKRRKNWRATIVVNHKQIYIGGFNDLNDARVARKEAEVKYGFHLNHGQHRPL